MINCNFTSFIISAAFFPPSCFFKYLFRLLVTAAHNWLYSCLLCLGFCKCAFPLIPLNLLSPFNIYNPQCWCRFYYLCRLWFVAVILFCFGLAGGGQPRRCAPTLLHHHPAPHPLLHPLVWGESVGQHQTIRYVWKPHLYLRNSKWGNAVPVLQRCWKRFYFGCSFPLSLTRQRK